MVSKVLCLLAVYSILLLQGDDRSSKIPTALASCSANSHGCWLACAFMTC